MVYLTRKEHFNAAHRLRRDDWSEEKNQLVFGKCANKNWHGHNYDLYVTVKGEPDPETGFIINAKELSRIIREKIIDQLDHKNLDLDVPFMKGKFTSTENLVKEIWRQLEPHLTGCRLHCIKLQETDTIWCEYYGE
ncbi:MAG: 6-carboxy-5,6,7,8-tetrahydropterin synthase [Chitinophagales bacterium]|nr:MAG: 6-carboxy-5,6,7,8-tetrahydropterin synthase [Chitinophagales bacterium]